ncbi:M20/M25/M40 family metallo-hydrolase [Ancylomarina salipaludis]|uniref:M20/M25/M40 family metallo-hydrolase n=1 Tax=Ancylomarina salipaludis TaxID=2501299 RepID=A0A4Q1JPA1_9BACT|nr:M20/M25/M40 family metallo-hydrolase [Ancylomarina salipaludis]RXQ95961.1 M20/M25/M40 family metallo-hydrolase [Ancylomarina salipaludis]
MKRLRFYLLLSIGLPLAGFSQNYSNIDFARQINEKELKKNVEVLSSAKMQGRETGTKGQKLAANFIYNQFKNCGLTGINKNTDSLNYFQSFNLSKLKLPSGKIQTERKSFSNYKDFIADPRQDSISLNINVVFIGNEPIENFSEIDFTDKAVLFLTSNFHKAYGRAHHIWKHSTPKLILFNDPINNKVFNRFLNTKKRVRNQRFLLNEPIQDSTHLSSQTDLYTCLKEKLIIPISTQMAKTLTGLKTKELKEIANKQKHLNKTTNCPIHFELNKEDDIIKTENVYALIEGSEKPNEYIVISSHYDHLGKQGEHLFYGANDNASGTAAVIEIAKAFKEAVNNGIRPKRSILFVAFTGEEKGLLGSKYFIDHSPVPLKSIKTNLNLDMLGRMDDKHSKSDYIYLLGTSHLNPKLKKMSDSLNTLHPKLILDYEYDQPNNPLYGASDQASFVRKGIPAIMYFNGLHQDYHTENDTADKLNNKNIERVAQLVFLTAWELANQL